MSTAVSIIVAIIILSILIIVHEFGHYLLARKNGIFVKEFSIGFGPRIISRIGKKTGTRFSLKALPFGGSCVMLGALEDDDEGADDKSYEKKSVWARMSVTLAGPVFNFLLAFVIAVIYVAVCGYDPAVVTDVSDGSAADKAGLIAGDVITDYGGTSINFGREIALEDYIQPIEERTEGIKISYVRDGKQYNSTIVPEEYSYFVLGISYYATNEPASLTAVSEDGAADIGGLESGDIITSINGTAISNGMDMSNYFDENPPDGKELDIKFSRRGGSMECTVIPTVASAYRLGFSYNRANVKTDAVGTLKYSLAELKYEIISVYKSLGMLLSPKGSLDMLSGPVGVVDVISDTYTSSVSYGFLVTLMNLLSIMMLLSVNLGVINLLPLPALDGGKFVLLIIEAIIRKPVPKKVEGIVTIIGAGLLVVLAASVLVNDVINLF